MSITASVSGPQITASVAEAGVSVSVGGGSGVSASVAGGVGPTGSAGPQGPAGPAGPAGSGGDYVLPVASSGTLGGVRIGAGVSIDGSGVISVSTAYAPESHTHTLSAVTDAGSAASRNVPASGNAASTEVVLGSDTRLADSREWSAATVDQAEAEAGTSTTRRAWTAQRVFQAVAAWWAGSAAKTKLDGIAAGATVNSTDAQLRDRATHTGTQAASTITGLAGVATTGVYSDLSGRPTLGTAAAAATTDFAAASHSHGNITNAGAIGTTSDQLVVTTTGGVLTTAASISSSQVSGLGTLATQSGTFSGTSSGTNTGDQTITLTGDVTGSGTGSFAATIANGAVTLAKTTGLQKTITSGTAAPTGGADGDIYLQYT